jgi:hypothetical protein
MLLAKKGQASVRGGARRDDLFEHHHAFAGADANVDASVEHRVEHRVEHGRARNVWSDERD